MPVELEKTLFQNIYGRTYLVNTCTLFVPVDDFIATFLLLITRVRN